MILVNKIKIGRYSNIKNKKGKDDKTKTLKGSKERKKYLRIMKMTK